MNTLPPAIPVGMYTETLTFVERRKEYGDVYTYIFSPTNPVPFTAGQYVHVRLLAEFPEGVKPVREFSFASAPHDAHIWFGIDARSGSLYQKTLLELLPGDTVQIFKIKSHMTWPAPHTDVVMIAGGIGVTPFRSMLLDAKHRKLDITSTLVHVSHESFLYGEELRSLVNDYRETNRGELTSTLNDVTLHHLSAHYYVVGSAGFVESVAEALRTKGVLQIESDVFKGLLDE